jgi:twitching motility protein PilT
VWRQDPDVVVIDRLRDADVAAEALNLAETGHLVISTMPTTGAGETCNALVELFPLSRQPQVRATLARCLRGIVSQRLLERLDRPGRVPAAEVLVGTRNVQERLAEASGAVQVDDLIADGDLHGMLLFDEALFLLARAGVVAVGDAVAAARDPRELRLALQTEGIGAAP